MKIGLVYPQTEYGSDPGAIREYAQTAEGLGFTHVLAYDHVLGARPHSPESWPGPYTYQHAFQSPLLLYSYMAAVTEVLGFVTGIIILPQRQTALFAKQAATLDILCGGRLRLGIGIGWNAVEFEALNENFHNRGKRIEDQVKLLRALWGQPLVNYHSDWHTIRDAGLNPLPVQRPIPIWFGGHAKPVLRRVAQMGDGWIPNYRRVAEARDSLDLIRRYLEEAGRAPRDIGIEPRLVYGAGDPDHWTEIIREWEDAGATHLSFNTMGSGFDTPQQHLGAITEFARTLGMV
jgi:probable F420-dependent oxidoreductase